MCVNLLFGIMFAENCIKVKELDREWECVPSTALDPPIQMSFT